MTLEYAQTEEQVPQDAPSVKVPRGHIWRARTWLHGPALIVAFWLAHPTPVSVAAGLPIVLLGLLVRTWALGCISKDQTLCTAGPYSLVRHPLYVGNMLVLAGALALAHSLPLALGALPLAALYYTSVLREEERWLASHFGEAWAEYAAKVPLFLPRIAAPTRGFSWERARLNQAPLNWLLLGVVVAVISAKPLLPGLFG